MKKLLFSLIWSAAIVAAAPVTVSYDNPGSPQLKDSTGAFVGPYTLDLNGKDVAAMCMDDFHLVSGTWQANVTGVTSSNLSNTYLGNSNYSIMGVTVSSSQVYDAEAYLFSQIIKPGADRVTLQDAAWTLMDYVEGVTPHSTSSGVDNVLASLPNELKTFDATDYAIVSQVDPGKNAEQEFIVATPEPASWTLFAMGGLLAGFGLFMNRRRAVVNN